MQEYHLRKHNNRSTTLSTFFDPRLGLQEPVGPPPEITTVSDTGTFEAPTPGSMRPPEPAAADDRWGDWGPVGREPKSSSHAAPYRPRSPDP